MAQRPSHVPKFGNWDANDNVAYTVVFDQARGSKGSKPINPNDPAENPSAFGLKPDDPLDAQRNRANVRATPPASWERRPDPAPPRHPVSDRPDKGAALPKFGAWDENDPSSGDGYTMIFSKAKDERKAGGPMHIPPPRNEPPAMTPPHERYRQQPPEAGHSKKASFWCCGVL